MAPVKKRSSAGPGRKDALAPGLSNTLATCGGILVMVVFAGLVAVRWDPGLADFLFWLTTIWIMMARSMASGPSPEGGRAMSRTARRKWLRFSAILVMAAASLYALARMAASSGWL